MVEKKRKGINSQTGQELQIPAKNVPKFMPGKGFKREDEVIGSG